MKIAIDTIIDHSNYENSLQNYATQGILKRLGPNIIKIQN